MHQVVVTVVSAARVLKAPIVEEMLMIVYPFPVLTVEDVLTGSIGFDVNVHQDLQVLTAVSMLMNALHPHVSKGRPV